MKDFLCQIVAKAKKVKDISEFRGKADTHFRLNPAEIFRRYGTSVCGISVAAARIPRQLRPAESCTPGAVESTGGWDTGTM